MKRPKPKFHVGQVLFQDNEGIYMFVETLYWDEDYPSYVYRGEKGYAWPERTLRRLTKREAGR